MSKIWLLTCILMPKLSLEAVFAANTFTPEHFPGDLLPTGPHMGMLLEIGR